MRSYSITDGIVNLLEENELSQGKKNEISGWRERRRKQSSEPAEESLNSIGRANERDTTAHYLLSLPYVSEKIVKSKNDLAYWGITASCFDICLQRIPNLKGARLLDIGAGIGWASRRFAERGFTTIAMDILHDHMLEANELMRFSGIYFDRVVGDYESLPFIDNSFDIIFSCSSLHHSSHPTLLVRELKRVLKIHGRIIIINEPLRSIFQSEQNLLRDSEERKLGISEHIYNYWEYKLPFLINWLRSEFYLEEFHNPNKMEMWLKEKALTKRVSAALLRAAFKYGGLKKLYQLFWALFRGGCFNIQARKLF
jgi:ubiquinone/menaquinone biosynthesis C-methylase UbiE